MLLFVWEDDIKLLMHGLLLFLLSLNLSGCCCQCNFNTPLTLQSHTSRERTAGTPYLNVPI